MKKMIISSICAMFLAGCTYQQADKIAPLENVINKGEKFRITLPENHTTGYMWQINNTFNDKVLDYYGSVFRGNEKGVDFNFTALAAGKTTVKFALIKYNDTTDVKQFIIDVK
ncbi:MAG: protease inhibitor I42 family protein [Bacteroidetes bacterium]|jgi:predicted secreted protein|nr:protease inhibitor I42 family protein [Bacteroidota bacterium]MBK8368550.1 protease inhibitor I42 family protein [Bacteroidota bacterium]